MNNKGVVAIIELIISLVALFVAYGILFPGFSYQNRWGDASVIIKARDIILTTDRIGTLYNYSFNATHLQPFLNNVVKQNLVSWTETAGTFRSSITVACNCTVNETAFLIYWIGKVHVNDRDVTIDFVPTTLDNIYPFSDALLIVGYKNTNPYIQQIRDYMKSGNGVVEIVDFPTAASVDSDRVQTEIFGIGSQVAVPVPTYDEFMIPAVGVTSDIKYTPYKYFYHLPVTMKGNALTPCPAGCGNCPYPTILRGDFTMRTRNYSIWICNSTGVLIDTNGDGSADNSYSAGNSFSLVDGGTPYNFKLNYVESNTTIDISFRPVFQFTNFINSPQNVQPLPNPLSSRILVRGCTAGCSQTKPGVILNSSVGNVAWMANFSSQGWPAPAGHDHMELIASLLLWASNKNAQQVSLGNVKTGFLTSYINAVNKDMYEAYKFNLGLGFPF